MAIETGPFTSLNLRHQPTGDGHRSRSRAFANWVWTYDTISHASMGTGKTDRDRASLHYAAHHGFYRAAEWLITTSSQDVNLSGHDFSTPLHIASKKEGWFIVVQVLLKYHADVDAGSQRYTPLHLASLYGHPKVARLLLERGADVNRKADHGDTPLRFLSEADGNLKIAQMLLDHGADPNARSISGWNTLHAAFRKGHRGLAQLLLKRGADPNARDVHGWTLLPWRHDSEADQTDVFPVEPTCRPNYSTQPKAWR